MKVLAIARKIQATCDFSTTTTREALEYMSVDSADFTVENYRFIHTNDIDSIQENELGDEEYILGCFNANFLAEVLEMDIDVIEAMQKAEAFEAVGKLIKSMGKLSELQQKYASYDGYGHHFAHYDHNEEEIGEYHVFRIN